VAEGVEGSACRTRLGAHSSGYRRTLDRRVAREQSRVVARRVHGSVHESRRHAACPLSHGQTLADRELNLRESSKSIAQLAHAVGYASEEAFSRAFKREFGISPARFRIQAVSGKS
jgi:AraC-like DNA-binding protein